MARGRVRPRAHRLLDGRAAAARDLGRSDDAVRHRRQARYGATSRSREPGRIDGRNRGLGRRVRVQLRRSLGLAAAAVAFAAAAAEGIARAQYVTFDTAHSVFYEAPTKTHMLVYSPSADLTASPWKWIDVSGGWQA